MWPQHIISSQTLGGGGRVQIAIALVVISCQFVISYEAQERHYNTTEPKGSIPVNILMMPAHYWASKNYIATNVSLTAKAEILDERFKNASMRFQWSVKNVTIVNPQNPSEIQYKFTKADEDEFLELTVTHCPNDTGMSHKRLVIRDPIVVQETSGKLSLEHGELLDITLNFTGTGPITYCHKFCLDKGKNQDTLDCSECSPDIKTTRKQVSIIKYLHNVGNYRLVFVADNIASRVFKSYSVEITDTVRPKSVPFVPIVSSILAVVIVLTGLALHIKFKRAIVTETADFDFIRHDYNEEDDFWDEENTFFQRVRYLFFKVNGDNDASVSDSVLSFPGSSF